MRVNEHLILSVGKAVVLFQRRTNCFRLDFLFDSAMTDILAKVEKSSAMKDDYVTGHCNLALKDQLSLCFCQRFSLAAHYVLIGLCDCHVNVDVILNHPVLFFGAEG